MPKAFSKRYLPKPEQIRLFRYLPLSGPHLRHRNLWHLNRRSVSRAVAIGLFVCFIPIPFQMILATAVAIFLRANLAISVTAVWISNPITMPPMFYFAYKVGNWLFPTKILPSPFEFSLDWFGHQIAIIWQPFLLGCGLCAMIAGSFGYFFTNLLWRFWILRALHKRQKRHQLYV